MGTINDKLAYLAETKAQLSQALIDKGITPTNNLRDNVDLVDTYTTDATATANDILSPKTSYVNGEKVTGSIMPTYKPSSETTTNDISFTGITILDYISSLGIIIYYKTDNKVIFFSNVTENIIDFDNEVEINSEDLVTTSTTFKDVKMQTNMNNNGSYSVCALLGSSTVLFDINVNNFTIVGEPTIIASANTLIYPNPKYKCFALTHYSTSSSRDIFTSYIRILNIDTKQLVYNNTYTDSGVSGATAVSKWNITGMFSPNGEMFIMNCAGFNRYSAVNSAAGNTRVIKFSHYYKNNAIKNWLFY